MVFGLSSSPGCSNFGFKQLASDYAEEFGCDVKDFIHNDFYVDDGLKPKFEQLASDYAEEFGYDVKDFIHNDFYVDDGLKSL